jgi:hypothetical protein
MMEKTTWAFPRHVRYEGILRKAAADWFAEKGFRVREKRKDILAKWF